MPTPSNVLMDHDSGQFIVTAPGSGSATTLAIPELIDVDFEPGGEHATHSGDAAPGATHGKVVKKTRKVTVTAAASGLLNQLTLLQGIEGVLSYNFLDIVNGAAAGGGGTHNVFNRCKFISGKSSGKHDEPGQMQLMFECLWARDSTTGAYTDPMVSTLL